MKTCSKCNIQIDDSKKFCTKCGRPLVSGQKVDAGIAVSKKQINVTASADDNKNDKQSSHSKMIICIVATAILLVTVSAIILYKQINSGNLSFTTKTTETPSKSEPNFITTVPSEKQIAPVPENPIYYIMEPFIVNLTDNKGDRYLKVVLQLELSDQLLADEFRLLQPKIRDSIMDLLKTKSYEEMMDPNGKQRLREEIVMRVNSFATRGKVLKVYFTEFVIQ